MFNNIFESTILSQELVKLPKSPFLLCMIHSYILNILQFPLITGEKEKY